MFVLRDLPRQEDLERFKADYPELDIAKMRGYLTLVKVGTDFMKNIDQYLKGHGIQQNRFMILAILLRNPNTSISASEIAQGIGVKRPTITGLLDGLERSGLISRSTDPNDRRSVLVAPTRKVHEYMREILPGYYSLINESMNAVSEKEAKQLAAILEKISFN